jgi:hypothetical protein
MKDKEYSRAVVNPGSGKSFRRRGSVVTCYSTTHHGALELRCWPGMGDTHGDKGASKYARKRILRYRTRPHLFRMLRLGPPGIIGVLCLCFLNKAADDLDHFHKLFPKAGMYGGYHPLVRSWAPLATKMELRAIEDQHVCSELNRPKVGQTVTDFSPLIVSEFVHSTCHAPSETTCSSKYSLILS